MGEMVLTPGSGLFFTRDNGIEADTRVWTPSPVRSTSKRPVLKRSHSSVAFRPSAPTALARSTSNPHRGASAEHKKVTTKLKTPAKELGKGVPKGGDTRRRRSRAKD